MLRHWLFRLPLTLRPFKAFVYWSPTVVFLSTQFYVPMHIKGRSMQPTLNPESSSWRDIGIFDRYSTRILGQYDRGDIVALRSPRNRKQILVKRIVATEGDVIRTLPPYPDHIAHIPPGHVWIEGDEHVYSDDSNQFGPVPAALIDSKLVGIAWPFSRLGRLSRKLRAKPARDTRREDQYDVDRSRPEEKQLAT